MSIPPPGSLSSQIRAYLSRPADFPAEFTAWLRNFLDEPANRTPKMGGGGGGINKITSTDGSVTVTGGNGPTTNLSVSAVVGATVQVRVPALDTPDFSGNAYPSLTKSNGFSNIQRLLPYFSHSGDGTWTGTIRVPQDYGSAGKIIISAVVNSASGAVRWVVSTAIVANGVTEDTSVTSETAQNITVPGVALKRFDTTFTLTTTPVAGSDMNVQLTRQASSGSDTCTAAAGIWSVAFQYTTA